VGERLRQAAGRIVVVEVRVALPVVARQGDRESELRERFDHRPRAGVDPVTGEELLHPGELGVEPRSLPVARVVAHEHAADGVGVVDREADLPPIVIGTIGSEVEQPGGGPQHLQDGTEIGLGAVHHGGCRLERHHGSLGTGRSLV